MTEISEVNKVLMRLPRRAEVNQRKNLVATFVDVTPLSHILSSLDHQVIYGRRGTGKTHILSYLTETVEKNWGGTVIYVDMRNLGSSGGFYDDQSIDISERSTRLLMDTLAQLHDGLLDYMIENAERFDLSRTGPILDRFAEAITKVKVVGTVESQESVGHSLENQKGADTSLAADSASGLKAGFRTTSSKKSALQMQHSVTESGKKRYTIHFGEVREVLRGIARALNPKHVWFLLDEWSQIPLELQPYLADLLRKSVLPVLGITVKIAAIEQRSNFLIPFEKGSYIGIEVGADMAADVNLDDFMVFDNDQNRARRFFQELIFNHYLAVKPSDVEVPESAEALIQQAFTQQKVFDEFVRASEGVPRDAINILIMASTKALDHLISMDHIRIAARDWYQRDKARVVTSNTEAHNVLHWIVDKVIGERRARAFLLRNDKKHGLIDDLFDARVLHILKKNISTHDQPGVRYDVYKLDYGCYVDLISTTKAVQGLLPLGENQFIDIPDVPPDDYRSIRRAILDIDQFSKP